MDNIQITIETLQKIADRCFKDADNAREDGLLILSGKYENDGFLIEDTIKKVEGEL